jgi:DNA-binding CsgD family transcriptional regulator/tetratricopeptide (TPR) repeat protein
MTVADTLRAGRESFARRVWAETYRLLEAADRESPLDPEDLERLATAAYLLGKDAESEAVRGRAHSELLNRGDREGAARSAFWLAFGLLQRGAFAPASGWLVRAERLLDEARLDCVVRGYLLIPLAIQRIGRGDAPAAHDVFSEAAGIASRFADRDLAALACHGRGRALVRMGRIPEGVARLDEAMAAVVAGDVSPVLAGDIYCSVLEACHEILDVRRAHEWTTCLSQWCATQPDLVRYRGECLIYRAEIEQMRGAWTEAERDAQEACALLSSPEPRPAVGAAFYRLGEIHRLRGDFRKAEDAYRQANQYGRKPQPGLALLRLAQGRVDIAASSIRSALAETEQRRTRARLLPVAVEIMVAAEDLETARTAETELSEIARTCGTPFLAAASAHVTGAVLLASAHPVEAMVPLRRAWESWHELEMPFEEAQARVLIATALQQIGDRDSRNIELDAARQLFKHLGAAPAITRTSELLEQPTSRPAGGLSEREVQVLRLVAAGKTNRAIADELYISEKTVARHVSNIFNKLGVSSRAGATALAYQRHLI